MARSSQNPAQEPASTIAAFAEELHDHLTQASSSGQLTLPDPFLYSLNQYLEQLPLLSGPIPVSSRRLLDSRGVELWNGCTRLISRTEGEVELGGLSEVRAFASALLECAASSHGSGKIRVLDVALKAARTCLDNEKLSLCLKILGIAAARLDVLETSDVDVDATRIRSLATEYYMLRIRLSLLQGRPDIAEHLFSKTPKAKSKEDEKNILETCYKVGKLSLSNGEYDTAAKWLGRALDSSEILSRQPDPESKEMRLLILHAVGQANIHIDTADSQIQLSKVQDTLKVEYGNLFPAKLIQLDILSRAESPSCEKYFEALIAAIQAMELTDENMDMIIYYIQKLRCWSFDLTVKAFKELLLNRLVLSDKRTWIEQCFVTLIWAITEHGTCAQNSLEVITDLAKSLTDSGHGPLSEEATHASLILIWRAMSMATSSGKLPDIEKWCNLILEQPIFQNCSLENNDKFQRKLLSCALESSDVSLSRRILNYMDIDSKSNPLALYLMYKLALLSEDSHLGFESLDKLWALDKKHLLSCAAEAQRLGKTGQAIDIFQRVISNLNDCNERINVAGIFQSTICLLSKQLEKGGKETNTHKILEEICTVFEAALFEANKQDSSRENSKFFQDDLGWLFHNAYSLALKSLDFSEPEYISRLLDVSGRFAALYQRHLKPEEKTEIHSHHLLCNFLKILKLVSEARKQSDPAKKTTNYQTIRDTVQTFRSQIPSQLSNKNNTAKERTEWTVKYRTMVAFDFEATIHLRQWTSLPNLIEEAKPIATDKLCCIFLDSILSSDAPIREILRVVKTIICTNHKTIPTKLPRYLHILFQLSLSPSSTEGAGSTITVAESVLDQILALARKSNSKPNPKITQASAITTSSTTTTTARSYYPNDELEWLATTVFNRAVDFYRDAADADCLRWAGKAIEVAELVRGDGEGVLVDLMRRNLSVLGIS